MNILTHMIFAYMAKRKGGGYTADLNLKEEMVAWVITGSWEMRQEDGSMESEKTHSMEKHQRDAILLVLKAYQVNKGNNRIG